MNQKSSGNEMKSYEFTIEGRNGIYTVAWEAIGITALVKDMQETRDHEVKGTVTFASTNPTSAGHLRFSKLNMTSATARNGMVKSLTAKDPEIDWDTVLEQLCVSVVQSYQRGVPAVQLNDAREIKDQESPWLIEPLIQLNNPTLIYAPGSTGKSWIAQYIAVLADEGLSETGFGVSKVNVLYLDWETDQKELGTRVKMIRGGLKLSLASTIWYRPMLRGLAQDIEEVRRACIEYNIGLVVIDSIGSACMGHPEDAAVVLELFTALRSLEISSLCVDHVNKEGILFGSVYKFNQARQVFEFRKEQHPEENKMIIGMFHRKANNSPLRREIGLELTFVDDVMTIERKDVRDTSLEENMRLSDRLQTLLKHIGSATIEEMAEETGKSKSHVRKTIWEHSGNNGKDALFTPIGQGKYGLAYRGDDSWMTL